MENSPAAAAAARSFFGVARPTLRLTAGAGALRRRRRRSSGPIDATAPPPAAHFGLIHANASRPPTIVIARQCLMLAACDRPRVCARPNFSLLCPQPAAASLGVAICWCVYAGIRSLPNRFIKTRARSPAGLSTLAPCFIYSPVMSNRCLRAPTTLKLILVTFYLHSRRILYTGVAFLLFSLCAAVVVRCVSWGILVTRRNMCFILSLLQSKRHRRQSCQRLISW